MLFLLCFVLIVFVLIVFGLFGVFLFVALALHHHLSTFCTGFKSADLSFMVDRLFTLNKVKYIDQFNHITLHLFDFTSSRIGKFVCDWFLVDIKNIYHDVFSLQ